MTYTIIEKLSDTKLPLNLIWKPEPNILDVVSKFYANKIPFDHWNSPTELMSQQASLKMPFLFGSVFLSAYKHHAEFHPVS